KQTREILGGNAVPLQIPIGAEENFIGVVDLINFRGIVWNEHDKGMTFKEVPIPDDLVEEAKEWREKMLEAVSEFDDKIMEKFFDAPETITEAEVLAALRKACLANKIATDPFVGRLCFFRTYSGRLDAGSYVLNTRSGNKERISRIFQMHANKQNAIDFIEAGDIGAAVGFKDIKTGDTLCAE